MLTEIVGDALNMKNGFLCHQTNCHGVMGAGIAASIKRCLLTKEQYDSYVAYCKSKGYQAIGTVQLLRVREGGLTVANMFCQDERLARSQNNARSNITDYTAMRKCFVQVRDMAQVLGVSVYIPHKIGCGIAGGDWNKVHAIIKDVFESSPVNVVIVERK